MVKRAEIKDAETLAGLAIQMWEYHTVEDLAEEFREMAAKEKGCTDFAGDCELVNETSLKFH